MAISFVGSVAGSTVNGNTFTMTLPSAAANDLVVVAYSVPRAITMGVTSSSTSTSYSQIIATTVNGNLNFSIWMRFMPDAVETQARCTGTGNAQDGSAGVAFVMRGVQTSDPLEFAGSTIGTGTTPDSPGFFMDPGDHIAFSLVGSLVADNTITAPTSFVNQTSTSATDTRSVTTAGAWITIPSSFDAFNPTNWSNFTSANWAAATLILHAASTAPWQDLTGPTNRPDWRKVYVEGY